MIIKKKITLIFIHGLGFNKKIWYFFKKKFEKKFLINTLNLHTPYKKNNFNIELKKFIKNKISQIPKNSILIGWSIGGIIATLISLKEKNKILLLITIASSPCFKKKKNWPGINNYQIDQMKKKLLYNYKNSIKNFINFQKNNENEKKIKILYEKLIHMKKINNSSLEFNIKILKKIDLRNMLKKIKIPIIRIYGSLDNIVPIKISKILDNLLKKKSYIIKKSNHAPFISHLENCYKIIIKCIKKNVPKNL
ncbi:Pimeloyl-[acyl-carrier protein] methyl ester esterase [Buchnera aphidicola (Periphyllus testudinaceus)]|uniref:alpha/beta fold hydrolase n=1 Tax=Buchnera aphidicola TaxID=9 RepID=UPI003464B1C2